ncbi:unnamed protein product [Pieris macdunnoughi]|uniref:Uncharacterized protein n=1 Tax=Pieris macdunnoughi TaxID=345717 RepID=A0A821RF61_9NEOP|nr:unnamed protein product [Pieris macdunnoughi]
MLCAERNYNWLTTPLNPQDSFIPRYESPRSAEASDQEQGWQPREGWSTKSVLGITATCTNPTTTPPYPIRTMWGRPALTLPWDASMLYWEP